jgi:two-component system, LytTR family, sensor kinase
LAEAQLQNLRLQLEPHFLFNALNAISATIYENPRAADEMIGSLGDLLRQLLKGEPAQEITLTREIELLRLFLGIMQARFEQRLSCSIDIDESASIALVPQLLLQPLVENAIRHGMHPVTFQADICVRARREGDQLHLTVRDHGAGFDAFAEAKHGMGLKNTEERLAALYADKHAFRKRNTPEGGAVIDIVLPFRTPNAVVGSPTRPLVPAEHILQ